jgi:hypothetical protein
MTKKITDLIKEESKLLHNKTGKMCYYSKPFPCAMDECLSHFKGFDAPDNNRLVIERLETSTKINIKPLKGSGKRKLYTIEIWV